LKARESGELVIARRDPPTVPDLDEKPLEQVARTVEVRAKADGLIAIASRRNIGQTPLWMRVL
jgi:hypothetical protein